MLIPKIYPVTCHTDHVGIGSAFVVIQGFNEDGAKYIEKAISLGATEVLLEDQGFQVELQAMHKNVVFTKVDNARRALASISASRLGNPSAKLKIIGITGTKGKTTTAFLVEHILNTAGFKTAMLGTIKNKIIDQEEPATLTTLEADTLQMFFARCVAMGVTHVVMEVSAHALSLDRVCGVEFDVACFTNLGQDHMDFYDSMEKYFEAKCILFTQLKPKGKLVVNTDDVFGKRIAEDMENVIEASSGIQKNGINGLTVMVDGVLVKCPAIFGEFNASNIAMAFKVAKVLGVKEVNLETFSGVPGRLQMHRLKQGGYAFVDFAHNPSSMEVVLATLRKMTRHLIVLFGCGGDRDKEKRPVMGEIAGRYGDVVIVTSDNPRFEDRNTIIKEVLIGGQERVIVEPYRDKAISLAAELAKKDSIIAILGKGHENYNLIKGVKYHFNDFEEISRF